MTKLPSYSQLAAMSVLDRSNNLAYIAGNLRIELERFDNGEITMFNGQRLSDARRNTRRKLDRVYKRADEFGIYVGQPEKQAA